MTGPTWQRLLFLPRFSTASLRIPAIQRPPPNCSGVIVRAGCTWSMSITSALWVRACHPRPCADPSGPWLRSASRFLSAPHQCPRGDELYRLIVSSRLRAHHVLARRRPSHPARRWDNFAEAAPPRARVPTQSPRRAPYPLRPSQHRRGSGSPSRSHSGSAAVLPVAPLSEKGVIRRARRAPPRLALPAPASRFGFVSIRSPARPVRDDVHAHLAPAREGTRCARRRARCLKTNCR